MEIAGLFQFRIFLQVISGSLIFLPFKYPFLLQAVSYYKKRLNNLWTHQSPGRSQT